MNLDKSSNPYSPPATSTFPPPLNNDHQKPFYVVAEKKLWILFFATFSTYSVYWFYRQFEQWKESSGENIWPIPRAIFSIFFTHGLFKNIENRAKQVNPTLTNNINLSNDATLFVVATIANNFLDKVTRNSTNLIWTLVTIGLFFMMGKALQKAQRYANIACHDPKGSQNARLTWANYIWMVLGVLLWIVIIVDALLPDTI